MEIIVGIAVSLFTQAAKKYGKLDDLGTLALVFAVCTVAAFVYVYFQDASWWSTFMTVLATAGAFYTYIIRRFEDHK